MKQMKIILGLIVIFAVLFSQTGCAIITTRRVAVTAGKMAYDKMTEDKADDEQDEQQ